MAGAAARGFLGGAAEAASVVQLFTSSSFSVTFLLEIENYSKYNLKHENTQINRGRIETPIGDVRPGERKAMFAHKAGLSTCGSSGTIEFSLDDHQIVFLWSMPYHLRTASNYMAIGLTKKDSRRITHNEGTFGKMYDNQNIPGLDYHLKEFADDMTDVVIEDEEFTLIGNMGSASCVRSKIQIVPRYPGDCASEEIQNKIFPS